MGYLIIYSWYRYKFALCAPEICLEINHQVQKDQISLDVILSSSLEPMAGFINLA